MRRIIKPIPVSTAIILWVLMMLAVAPALPRAEDMDGNAQQLLNAMTSATRKLNYDGIFIYRRDHQMDTMRLIHKVAADGERERLVSLSGDPREVIRNRQTVTCIFPENQVIMVEKSRNHERISRQFPDSIDKVADHYKFSVVDQDRIAGRAAWVVAIRPADGYRYGYRLWIDKEHKLLLRSDLQNESGDTLEQILFTKLDVMENIPDDLLQPSVSGSGYTRIQTSETVAETVAEIVTKPVPWQIRWMPTGFNMRNYEQQSLEQEQQVVDHLVYSDGLAMVSIFIEKSRQPSRFVPGPLKKGALNAYARLANGYQVTAVGEVPQSTVQRMAISVITGP
jgi:sigma-E factor negative regulatory protein RseB